MLTARELENVNVEMRRVAKRASSLLDVTTALFRAKSVDDVENVVLTKGLAMIEAARGVLVSVNGDQLTVSNARHQSGTRGAAGYDHVRQRIPVVHALRKGE